RRIAGRLENLHYRSIEPPAVRLVRRVAGITPARPDGAVDLGAHVNGVLFDERHHEVIDGAETRRQPGGAPVDAVGIVGEGALAGREVVVGVVAVGEGQGLLFEVVGRLQAG